MIRFQDVRIRQGAFALDQLSFAIQENAYAILMGSSGSGKTTLVESICGLRDIERGSVLMDDRDVTGLPPFQRNIGYVPQDSVLFPAMRIDQQIEFSLEVRKINRARRAERVKQLAELTGIVDLLPRYPQGLSGGERQRVAVARALAFRPKLLCLDEPLAALDQKTKTQVASLLQRIHRQENVTILHITHDIAEAKTLGTAFFKIENGSVVEENEWKEKVTG